MRPRPFNLRRNSLIAALLLPALLWGCAMAPPEPTRDEAPLPQRFADAGTKPLPEHWWRYFDDPALDDLVRQALVGNFSLALARSRLRQAQAVARRDSAGLWPSLEADGEASRTRRSSDTATRTATRTDNSYTAGLAASYEVDLWGRIDAAARASEMESAATAADLRAAAVTVSADVAGTFYSLTRQRALVDLLQSQLETNRHIQELVTLRYRNGQASADEVLRQQQLVEQTRASLAEARAQTSLLRHQLAVLLGRPPGELAAPQRSKLTAVPALPAAGIPAEWLRQRPDLEAAFLRVRSANAEAAAAIAAQYPRIDLSASLQSSATTPGAVFNDWLSTLAANLTAPLFDGGQRRAEAQRAREAVRGTLADYAQTVLGAVREVQDALVAEHRDRQSLDSLDRQVRLAQDALDQLRNRYMNGATDYLNVLDALSSLQDTERSRLDAHWALIQDRITLARALAAGSEPTDTADAEPRE